jgi:hypothetical protein
MQAYWGNGGTALGILDQAFDGRELSALRPGRFISRETAPGSHWIGGWVGPRPGLGICLFTTASRPALGPTQLPIQRVPGALSLGLKRPGREANHSPPSAKVKHACSYTSTLPIRLHGLVLTGSTETTLPLPFLVLYIGIGMF